MSATVLSFPPVLSTGFQVKRETSVRTLRLGEVLIRQGVISKLKLQSAIQLQASYSKVGVGTKLGEILVAQDMITAQELKMALWEQFWRKQGFWVID